MADFSATHDQHGFLWIPKSQHSAPLSVDLPPDPSLDNLDLPRYKAELERRFALATRTCDSPTLSADQRQYSTGFKNGLKEALALLSVSRRVPEPQEPPSDL